jgi:RNase adaptor protein for sRNA GlmZ degradation
MRIQDIARRPTTTKEIDKTSKMSIHESCFRSYSILEQVKYYLTNNVPAKIILQLIDDMEDKGELE